MPSYLAQRALTMAMGSSSYGLLRYLRFQKDAAKLLSVAGFGLRADHDDLEFLTPLLLTPSMMYLLHRLGSHQVTQGVYALSNAYICLETLHAPHAVPKNVRLFMDKNSGTSKEVMARFRKECAEHGWITKEFTKSCSFPETAKRSIRTLAVSIGKLQLLTITVKIVMAQSLKIDVKKNIISWARTVTFCYVLFMMVGGLGIDRYNKLVHHWNDSEDIEQYRPTKTTQMAMFFAFAYLSLQIQSKSKHNVAASCIFFQAVITVMNKHNVRIKTFLPVIAYLFSRY